MSKVTGVERVPVVGKAVAEVYFKIPAPAIVPPSGKVSVPATVTVRPLLMVKVPLVPSVSAVETVKSVLVAVIEPLIVKLGMVFAAPFNVLPVPVMAKLTPVKVIDDLSVTSPVEVAFPEIMGVVAPEKSKLPNCWPTGVKVIEVPLKDKVLPEGAVKTPTFVKLKLPETDQVPVPRFRSLEPPPKAIVVEATIMSGLALAPVRSTPPEPDDKIIRLPKVALPAKVAVRPAVVPELLISTSPP